MYHISIAVNPKEPNAVTLETNSKGESRAIASACFKSKVPCTVTRQAAEVNVKYNFAPAATPVLPPTPPPLPSGKKK